MSKPQTPDVLKLRQLQEQASARTRRAAADTHISFWLHDIEQAELKEYLSLSPQDHAAILQEVGEERYKEYVNSMEKLRAKYGM